MGIGWVGPGWPRPPRCQPGRETRRGGMPTQAIPLALVSSLYPFGLVALLLLLSATRPRARSAVFLLGAAVCLLTVGFLFVFVLRGAGLNQGSNGTPRYGLRLGLGVLFLIGARVLAHRPPRPKAATDQ